MIGKTWQNNVTITFNVSNAKKAKTHFVHVSKQVILLMILNRQKCHAKSEGKQQWHYLAVIKLSTLLRGTKSKINGDFYCLNCLQSF